MNDYSSINDVCVERGMTMIWLDEDAILDEPNEEEPTESTAPEEP